MNSPLRRLKLFLHQLKVLLGVAQCKVLFLLAFVRNGFHCKYILAFPARPSPKSALFKIAHRLGYRITQDSSRPVDLVIAWEDCTVRTRNLELGRLASIRRVINLGVSDISKECVMEVFETIFGYSIQVDPERHAGLMVRKSNLNARHDGKVIQGPAPREEGFVYQRLINNVVAGRFQEARISVFGSHMCCLIERYPASQRFILNRGDGTLGTIGEVFSAFEIAQLQHFCAEMGLEYGAIDVLRDSNDGRIYVVDANNTPFGPIGRQLGDSGWFDRVSWRALGEMCVSFEQAFFERQRDLTPKTRWLREQ